MSNLVDITTRREADFEADASYLEQPEFADRKAAFMAGEFAFIGVYAVAHVEIHGVIQTIRTAGLWGIEDDSDESYLLEIEGQEIGDLRDMLRDMQVVS